MKNTKNYIHVLMLFGLISQITYTQNVYEQGKTKLIKYIEQRDTDLIDLQKEVSQLWNDSTYTTVDSTYSCNHKTETTTYNIKSSCSRYTLQKIYDGRQNLKNFTKDTQNQIAKIIQEGISINASDNQGKTALNYAKSRQVYNALRHEGADFQIDSFISMNEYQLKTMVALATVWAIVGATYLISSAIDDGKNQHENEGINIRDEMGRTSLMNYIIQEEDRINSFRGSIFCESLVFDIKVKIKSMIEQGARLDIKDFEGKTVMDYCTTAEIYNYLDSLKGPSHLMKWLDDNHTCLFYLTVASICTSMFVHISLSDQSGIPGVDEVDAYFKKHY